MPSTYSVVVPTHQRPDTLAVTLRCLAETAHPRLDVVVMDNAGGPETAAVIERARSTMALNWVRSDQHLSMQDSWEKGIAAATGDYITVIGDDDSLLRHTITVADHILSQIPAAALFWHPVHYYWPSALEPETRNILNTSIGPRAVKVDCMKLLNEWADSPCSWHFGPSIYQGFISRDLIERARRRLGRYVADKIPDVATMLVTTLEAAASSLTVLCTQTPLSIRGVSHNSHGQGFAYHRTPGSDHDRARFERAEGNAETPTVHPAIEGQSLAAILASVFLRMREAVLPAYGAAISADIAALRATVAAAVAPQGALQPGVSHDPAQGFIHIVADLSGLGISDVYGAMKFIEAFSPKPHAVG